MANTYTTTIVESCQVAPSAATDLSLQLVFFDVVFLFHPPQQVLTFYSFQCSESHFSDTIVPNLKKSLSITLNHFSPLAGKIIFPLNSSGITMPVSQYVAGDSVSLTIAVSKADLIPLTGNLSRDSDQFHDFVPDLPPAIHSSDSIIFSAAAIQVTLFPDQGICFGITNHHAVADGSTLIPFFNAWSSINKSGGEFVGSNSFSYYDRSRLLEEEDINALTTACWDLARARGPPTVSPANCMPWRGKKRATFVLSDLEIQKLKSFIVNKKPPLLMAASVSSFAAVCAHVWTCLAKSAGGAADDDDAPENFHCAVDCRRRLNPPLPDNYFGNCLTLAMAESTRGRLKGDLGIAIAADAISDAIQKTLNNEKGILDGYMNRIAKLRSNKQAGNRTVGVAGSPRFDVYGADFGWGSPKKYEFLQIDYDGSFSLCMAREFEGGVEIGMSMAEAEIDAFAAIFNQGLKEATQTDL